MFRSRKAPDIYISTVRRRRRLARQEAHKGRVGKVSRRVVTSPAMARLAFLAFLTLAFLTYTPRMVAREWNSQLSSPEECVELSEMDKAVRSLGLDGLPEYWESCFTLQDRVWTAARPVSEPTAAFLQKMTGGLHSVVRCVHHAATALPACLVDQMTALLEWQADTLLTVLRHHPDGVGGSKIHQHP
ncbi:hypothetical protein E2C01_065591 [Portunus trituberculatus]|uniref:Uncharacterized protein n=1 Tax=Portunus trituberculatus TaxID=210409 RepID=A0A5B7HQ07_PORTR|nr:hypothetical protein [Portunus trituberculatus]